MNDELADFEQLVADSLARHAEQLAGLILADLRRTLSGSSFYIRRGFAERDQQIRREFNGRNAHKLATQYGLSRRRIEQIVGR